MKKSNLNKKLQFNKETVAKLNNDQMNNVNGGLDTWTRALTCYGYACTGYTACGVASLPWCATFPPPKD
jgi:natural product precursor